MCAVPAVPDGWFKFSKRLVHTRAEGCTASTSGTASAVAQAFAEAVSSAAANAGCNYNLGSTASQASQTKVANAIAEACKLLVFSSFATFDACCESKNVVPTCP
jgi:hypothetical protein